MNRQNVEKIQIDMQKRQDEKIYETFKKDEKNKN